MAGNLQDPKSPSPERSEEDEAEQGIDAKFISHCLRRQELTLVILSNVVLRKNVVLNRLCPQEEVASQVWPRFNNKIYILPLIHLGLRRA